MVAVVLGKGTPVGNNSIGGGHAIARQITANQTFVADHVGIRVNAINASNTSKYRVALYAGNSSTPTTPLAQSNEVGFSDGIVAATDTTFLIPLTTTPTITRGTIFYVVLFQNPNSDCTMKIDDATGVGSSSSVGYYETGSPGNTTPDVTWSGSSTSSAWMLWVEGTQPPGLIINYLGETTIDSGSYIPTYDFGNFTVPTGGGLLVTLITGALNGASDPLLNLKYGTQVANIQLDDIFGGLIVSIIGTYVMAAGTYDITLNFNTNSRGIYSAYVYLITGYSSEIPSSIAHIYTSGSGMTSLANNALTYTTGGGAIHACAAYMSSGFGATSWSSAFVDANVTDFNGVKWSSADINGLTAGSHVETATFSSTNGGGAAMLGAVWDAAISGTSDSGANASITYTGEAATDTLGFQDSVLHGTISYTGQVAHDIVGLFSAGLNASIVFTGKGATESDSASDRGAVASVTFTGFGAIDLAGHIDNGANATLVFHEKNATESIAGMSILAAQLTQEQILVLTQGSRKTRMTQEFVQLLVTGQTKAQLSQIQILALANVRAAPKNANEATQIITRF
jgi:hypothetical protein